MKHSEMISSKSDNIWEDTLLFISVFKIDINHNTEDIIAVLLNLRMKKTGWYIYVELSLKL